MYSIDGRKSQTAQLGESCSALHARRWLHHGEPCSAFHAEGLITEKCTNGKLQYLCKKNTGYHESPSKGLIFYMPENLHIKLK
jgi:hypothetical protein